MKSKIKILVIFLALLISSVVATKQVSAQQANIGFQVFYDQLSPYGQWVDYPDYGYVWIPDAGSDFVPYLSGGHWIITDYGWTWLSDYNWGWAPFHYGRWDYNDYYGWFWIPDNEWGPAWVSWRRARGYYGWEPLGPGISINMSFGREYDNRNDHWIFVRDRYIDRSDMNHFYVNRNDHDRIIRNSTIINNTYIDNERHATYIAGPARNDVQKSIGRPVRPVTIQENNKPGQEMSNGRLNIYRPQIVRNNNMGQRPAPSRIVDPKDVKRPSERNAANQSQTVSQPRTENKPQTVNSPQTENQTQTVNRPQAGKQPQTVNRSQTVNTPQNVYQPDKNRQEPQSNTANPQRSNNNAKAQEQQNANPSQNNRSERQSATPKPEVKRNIEQQKKSESVQNKKEEINDHYTRRI